LQYITLVIYLLFVEHTKLQCFIHNVQYWIWTSEVKINVLGTQRYLIPHIFFFTTTDHTSTDIILIITAREETYSLCLLNFSTHFGMEEWTVSAISYYMHITGQQEIGIKMTLVSFAVEVILDSITAENKGTRIDGMDNVCIRVLELSHSLCDSCQTLAQHRQLSSL